MSLDREGFIIKTHLAAVGTETEVLNSLTGVLGTSQEESVGTSRAALSELVEGEALTAGSSDASTGGGSEAKGSDRELGDLVNTVVIGDSANNDDGLALVCLARVLVCSSGHDSGDGHWGTVDLGHVEASEDGCVELAVGTACRCYSQP